MLAVPREDTSPEITETTDQIPPRSGLISPADEPDPAPTAPSDPTAWQPTELAAMVLTGVLILVGVCFIVWRFW